MLGLGVSTLKGIVNCYNPTRCVDFGEDTDEELIFWQQLPSTSSPEGNDPWHKDTWSMSIWIKPTDEASQSPIYTHTDSITDGIQIYLNDVEKLNIKINNISKLASTACTAGAWNHIFISLNNSTNKLRCYLNNSLVITDNSFTEATDVSNSYRYLGYNAHLSGPSQFFSGKMFEWAVWKSDETANVAAYYNGGVWQDMRQYEPYFWYSFGNNNGDADDGSSVYSLMPGLPGSKVQSHFESLANTADFALDIPE